MNSKALDELKSNLALSEEQREVLIGLLLGDSCLETQNGGQTYRLKVEQSARHQAYVEHLYAIFREWVLGSPRLKQVSSRGHMSQNVTFQTISHGAFRFYAQQFYHEGRKRVPKLIHRWLTPRAMAYWFMDDGSIKSKQSKGVIFNTQAFQRKDVERLCLAMSQLFGLKAWPRKQRDGLQIYISGKSFDLFRSIIEPYVIPEMRYKLPSPRRT